MSFNNHSVVSKSYANLVVSITSILLWRYRVVVSLDNIFITIINSRIGNLLWQLSITMPIAYKSL